MGIKQSFLAAGVVDVSFADICIEADVCLPVYRLSPVPANLHANRSLKIPYSQGIQSYCQIIIRVQVFGFLWKKTEKKLCVWLSQDFSKWLIHGLFHLLINGIYLGYYNPFTITIHPNIPGTSPSRRHFRPPPQLEPPWKAFQVVLGSGLPCLVADHCGRLHLCDASHTPGRCQKASSSLTGRVVFFQRNGRCLGVVKIHRIHGTIVYLPVIILGVITKPYK